MENGYSPVPDAGSMFDMVEALAASLKECHDKIRELIKENNRLTEELARLR